MVIRAVCCCLRRFRGHLVDSGPSWDVPHSSRGLGHRPLKAEITGSNPVCGTKFVIFGPIHARIGPLVALILGRGTLIGTLMPGPRSIWAPGSSSSHRFDAGAFSSPTSGASSGERPRIASRRPMASGGALLVLGADASSQAIEEGAGAG